MIQFKAKQGASSQDEPNLFLLFAVRLDQPRVNRLNLPHYCVIVNEWEATRNSLQSSLIWKKRNVSIRASSCKLSPQGYSFSLGHYLFLPGGVKCILVDISEWLAAPLSWLNAKHELKCINCFVCLVPCLWVDILCHSAGKIIGLTERGELQTNAQVSEGKEWGGYTQEGVCVCICVQMAFPGPCLLHTIKGHHWQGRAVYVSSATTVLILKKQQDNQGKTMKSKSDKKEGKGDNSQTT